MSTETEKKKKRKEKFEKNFNILTKKNYTELSEKQKETFDLFISEGVFDISTCEKVKKYVLKLLSNDDVSIFFDTKWNVITIFLCFYFIFFTKFK